MVLILLKRDTTTRWSLDNIILRAECVNLDSAVNNNITSHLLQGGSLKIVYPMYHTITQSFKRIRNRN